MEIEIIAFQECDHELLGLRDSYLPTVSLRRC
jgi:hypothetical protein